VRASKRNTDRSEVEPEHSIEEERTAGHDASRDRDAEPPTLDGEEPDTRQLDPDVAEPASHPDPDPDALRVSVQPDRARATR
jgi:hypothetical protein